MTVVTNKGKVFALNKTEKFDVLGLSDKIKDIRSTFDDPNKHQDEIAEIILHEIGNYGVQYEK